MPLSATEVPAPPRTSHRLLLGGALLMVAASFAVRTALMPLNDDVAWFLICGRKLLAGHGLYGRDIVDVNQPAVVYFSAAIDRIADMISLNEMHVYTSIVLLFCIGCLVAVGMLARRVWRELPWGIPVIASAWVVLMMPRLNFGERDQFMLCGLLAYVMVVTARLRGQRVGLAATTLTGMLLALGIAFKPFYVALLAGPEILLLPARRERPWRRPEILLPLLLLTGYVVFVLWTQPEYLRLVIPMGRDTYWAFQQPVRELIGPHGRVLIPGLLTFFLVPKQERRISLVFGTAGIMGFVVFLAEGTGWTYKFFPAEGMLLVWAAVNLMLAAPRLGALVRLRDGRWRLAACAAGLFLFGSTLAYQTVSYVRQEKLRLGKLYALRQELLLQHDHSFAALSPCIMPPFPLETQDGIRWTSRFPTVWLIPALVKDESHTCPGPHCVTAERAAWLKHFQTEAIAEDLAREKPDAVLVYAGKDATELPGDFRVVDFMSASGAFASEWHHYRFDAAINDYEIYQRVGRD